MAESECSSGMVVVGSPTCITRHLLVCKIRELGHSHERLGEKLIDFYYEVGGNADYMIVKGCITQFLKTFRLKLKKYNRMYERFLEKETEWCSKYLLDEDITCSAIAGPVVRQKISRIVLFVQKNVRPLKFHPNIHLKLLLWPLNTALNLVLAKKT